MYNKRRYSCQYVSLSINQKLVLINDSSQLESTFMEDYVCLRLLTSDYVCLRLLTGNYKTLNTIDTNKFQNSHLLREIFIFVRLHGVGRESKAPIPVLYTERLCRKHDTEAT